MLKCRCSTWDWKGQVDIEELNFFVQEVFNGRDVPVLIGVETECDMFAVVVCEKEITQEQAQGLYEAYETSFRDSED
jgi:hypothetical protein